MISIIMYLVVVALIALLGEKRKIGGGWAFALSLFLSPIIGLIITLCSKKKDVDFIDEQK
ncbi:MAG: hypothetical protein IJL56_08495 [Bacteroidales bacterium]|nr:hypothetical protein [Bacteroidales bacterium]